MASNGITEFPEEFVQRYRSEGYWRGELLGDLLRDWAVRDPGRTALVESSGRWSYGELDQRSDRVAAGLSALGIRRGDRLVVQLPNTAAFAITTIALFRLGAIPIFALPAHRRAEIGYLCESSQAVGYITTDVHLGFDHREIARQLGKSMRAPGHVIISGEPQEFVELQSIERPAQILQSPCSRDVAFFLLSGGTTGMPKLIPRTHDDYAYQLRATAEGLGFSQDDVYLAVLPIAHNAALGCPGLLGALRAGGKVVLLTNPSPDEAFPLIEQEGVTLTTLMPPLVSLWLEARESYDVDLSGLVLQVGSARFAPELARRVRSELGCHLTHWFGMAEGLLTFTRLDDPDDVVDGTQGRPLSPADEILVVDESGNAVPRGRIGELLARGPYTLRGYYNAPDHNERVFTPDGFLHTGDLVRMTPEGNMIVEGRLKDVINRGGEKVSAGELEDLLLTHPKIRQVAVVAVPDPVMGERICAFVVARHENPELAELKTFLREQGLAEYKLPERLECTTSLPLTKVGKVDKGQLRLVASRV